MSTSAMSTPGSLRRSLLPDLSPYQKTFLLMMVATAIAGLSSCTQGSSSPNTQASPQNQASPAATTTLKIVTSTLPVTDFTKAVVGDRADVTYLLPPNVGPHDYQAKPEDVRTLAEANVLVKNGLGIDEYLDGLVENASNPKLKIIDTSEGVQTISNEEVEGNHENEAHEAEKAGREAAAEGHEHEGELNPHIWLDPKRAVEQVENIRDGLIAADPAGKETYSANAEVYIKKLDTLDQEIATALTPYAGKEFVTYHDFAPYFAQRYGLKAQFLVGVPEENPAPADVQHVIDSAKRSDLKTLLTEPQAVGNPFDALAKDLKVQVSNFDPIETSRPEGVEADYYLTVMRQNLKNLQTALGSAQSQLPRSTSPLSTSPLLSLLAAVGW
jgi:zinc transport system substrate-binding protein